MSMMRYAPLALILPLCAAFAAPASAQYRSSSQYGTSGVQAPSISGQSAPAALSPAETVRPQVNVPEQATAPFEQNPVLSIPKAFAHQWQLGTDIPPESLISERYLRTQDKVARKLTLKEAIYIAIRNNPGLTAVQLDPIAAEESVKLANAAFDPDLTSQIDVTKSVVPVTSPFQVENSEAFTQKLYDWNFGVNKVSALTNGTLGLTFDNNRTLTNSTFAAVNPAYTPELAMSLVQPLLRNFGWKFATLNVRLSESAQKSAQWTYGSSLNDFVQRIGNDYWGVVQADENLQVAEAALKFNNDLVRINRISLQVGTLAPIDLQEAESAAATAEANVYAAEAVLKTARAQLRQDVMLNPAGTFVPEDIEPAEGPNPGYVVNDSEETALERMVEYSPALGGLREAIRTALLQVKFAENQTLPQLNLGSQFGVTAVSGTTPCIANFSSHGVASNCTVPTTGTPVAGTRLPFGGIYGDALNRMLDAKFYNYAAVLSFEMPLDNAAAKAALAQARVAYEQSRMQYREALSQSVVQIESALANLHAFVKQVEATNKASFYAEQSLRDEQVEFRVGMATTHDLLQYQDELVTAQGNQVQASVGLENARLALWHAEGTLLNIFNISFQVQEPHVAPWYSDF
ncbi:MAG TPA: TolC family protein [Candidatus Binataceae bacterium]|nr:TolC family protein [Candidatus Binataceae bacterium]